MMRLKSGQLGIRRILPLNGSPLLAGVQVPADLADAEQPSATHDDADAVGEPRQAEGEAQHSRLRSVPIMAEQHAEQAHGECVQQSPVVTRPTPRSPSSMSAK